MTQMSTVTGRQNSKSAHLSKHSPSTRFQTGLGHCNTNLHKERIALLKQMPVWSTSDEPHHQPNVLMTAFYNYNDDDDDDV